MGGPPVLGVHATVERNWEGALLVEAERVFDIANRSALVSLLPGDWKLPIWKPLEMECF
jgi:hypothetical protein